jgi:hypothetical protein
VQDCDVKREATAAAGELFLANLGGGPLLVMDGKVAGALTWKAGEGENLNFAAPSKLIVPLLANSEMRPLGTSSKTVSGSSTELGKEKVWTPLNSGRDFKLRIDGDYIYTEWIILPPQLLTTAAFMRSELKKDGDKWVGKVRMRLPYSYKSAYFDFWKTGQQVGTENVNWCSFESEFEIDKLTDSRIEGRAFDSTSIDVKKCKAGKREWHSFVWIPK